jgi:hypothetical protein
MDRFITFMAMEVLVCHWDGYCMNKNNFRVYHDLDSNRIMFMPHGMDQMFGVMMVQATMSVRPPLQGLVAKAVMDTPQGRRRYYEKLADLNRTLFNVDRITNEIYQTTARVRPTLASFSASAAANHEAAVADLCDRIVQRKLSLDEQFAGGGGQVIEFDSAGMARLSGWASQTNFGKAILGQEAGPSGRPVLHIRAAGSSVGSWRTKVLLEEGHYSFEGRMQTRDVVTDPRDIRAGAGLRVWHQPGPQKTKGDLDWKEIAFEFDVPDGLRDVELVCELRAQRGDAWFDLDSLRLVRK